MQNVRRGVHTARLYPVPAQASQLEEQGHTARALWNLLHEWYTCRNGGIARRPTIAEMDRQLRRARTDPLPGWEWLAQLPAKATQQVLRQHPLIGPTRFRWTCPLPGVSRDCPGRITGARLVRKPLGWHVCFRLELPAAVAPANAGPPVGMDRGVAHTIALSNGRLLDMPELLSKGERRRLRKLELQAARRRIAREPGSRSSRRERATYGLIAELCARQSRRREDWLHKTTTNLAKSHGLIALEDLHVKNMTRSARAAA